jgi:hypothetical protein
MHQREPNPRVKDEQPSSTLDLLLEELARWREAARNIVRSGPDEEVYVDASPTWY